MPENALCIYVQEEELPAEPVKKEMTKADVEKMLMNHQMSEMKFCGKFW